MVKLLGLEPPICPDCVGSGTFQGEQCGCGPGVHHVANCGRPPRPCPRCKGTGESPWTARELGRPDPPKTRKAVFFECDHLRPVARLGGVWFHLDDHGGMLAQCEAGGYRIETDVPVRMHTVDKLVP